MLLFPRLNGSCSFFFSTNFSISSRLPTEYFAFFLGLTENWPNSQMLLSSPVTTLCFTSPQPECNSAGLTGSCILTVKAFLRHSLKLIIPMLYLPLFLLSINEWCPCHCLTCFKDAGLRPWAGQGGWEIRGEGSPNGWQLSKGRWRSNHGHTIQEKECGY